MKPNFSVVAADTKDVKRQKLQIISIDTYNELNVILRSLKYKLYNDRFF